MSIEKKYLDIKNSFNKASDTYLRYSHLQSEICNQLLQIIKETETTHKVVDFACGTGIGVEKLLQRFNDIKICYAVDIADKLLKIAKRNLVGKNIQFIEKNFNENIFGENALDLGLCNMGFQWSLDLMHTFQVMYEQLKVGGILAFSIPLHGSFNQLKPEHRNDFYHDTVIVNMLKQQKFNLIQYKTLHYNQFFTSALHALRSIKRIVGNLLIHEKRNRFFTKELENFFIDPKKISLAYRIGLFTAHKS